MSMKIRITRVTFDRRAVTLLRFGQFALLEINITQFRVVMRLVQVMDLRLQLANPMPLVGPRQFESPGGGGLRAINQKIIQDRVEQRKNDNEHHPNPFLPPDRIDEHPKLESQTHQQQWVLQV